MWYYRYRDLGKWTKDILQNNRLYYTNPRAFNDPFDCALPFDFSASKTEMLKMIFEAAVHAGLDPTLAMKRASSALKKSPAIASSTGNAKVESIKDTTSLCCFAATGHNILMFSHYADSHRGICLQFSYESRRRLGHPIPVIYKDQYPELRYFNLRNRGGELVKSLFLTKHVDWEYERESRVVRLNQPAGLVSFLPSDLTGIIFGCKSTNADVAKVKRWLKKGGSRPNLYKARVSDSKFELVVVGI